MTTGLFLGLLLFCSCSIWWMIVQHRECLFKSKIIAAEKTAVMVTDATRPDHTIVYVNQEFTVLTGYHEAEVIGRTMALLTGLETERGAVEKLAMGLEDGRACRVCLRHYRKVGSTFWNEVTLSPVRNRAGEVTAVIWVMRDVSAQKEIEARLQQTEEAVTLVSDLDSAGLMVIADAKIAFVNKMAVGLLGAVSCEQLVGKSYNEVVQAQSQEGFRLGMAKRVGHPPIPVQAEFLGVDGRTLHATTTPIPLHWKGDVATLLRFTDVRADHHAEAGISPSAEQPQTTGQVTRVGTVEWDAHSGVANWSGEQYRIFGYEPGSITPTHDTFTHALHPDDAEAVLRAIDQTLTTKSPYDVECRIIRPGGDIRFVRCRGYVASDSTNLKTRMIGTVQDVTESALIEGLVHERDRQLQAVVESASNGVLILRQDDSISLVNREVERVFGYVRDELLGQPVELLLPTWPDVKQLEDPASVLLKPDPESIKVRRALYGLRKDGSTFPVQVDLTPIRLPSVVSLLMLVTDMTVSRQTETALRESEQRVELAVQAGQVGMFEHDHQTDSLYWSPILRSIYGLGMEESATLARYHALVHPDDREWIAASVRRAHAPSGDGVFEVEHRILRPDGAIRYIHLRSMTLFDGEGALRQPIRTIGTVVDVTDRRQAEAQQSQTSKMEAIGTFAGGIAHEFNNSLTAVLGFSELALPLIPTDSKASRHVSQVIAAGRKSRELVHQLLTFSRQSDQVRCPLSLHSLVKESLKLLRPTIPLWIELRELIAKSTGPILANTTQMHQMILNLIEHALHAMRKTGGILEIQLQNTEFAADQMTPGGKLRAGGYACFTVRDTGEGMEPEVVSRLLDSFQTTKVSGEGRGMGLSVVHGIVTTHGGTISVESRVDSGTMVSIYLPLLPSRQGSASEGEEPLPRGYERILFVDDDEALVRCGAEMLESLGYYAVVRQSAEEAWEAFQIAPQQFDLLITDQSMSGMSGDVLARECQRLRPDLPVILCSGSDHILSQDEACLEGITAFVLKPLTLRELAHMIRRALERSRSLHPSNSFTSTAVQSRPSLLIEGSDAISPRR